MKAQKSIIKVLTFVYLFCCISCANLEHINKYAHSSVESIAKFKEIPFSFEDYCRHYQETALTNTIQYDIAPLPKLDCKFYSKSDSALKVFNSVLMAYLQGLEKLSAKDLVDYDLANATTNLQTLGGNLGWQPNDTQVTAAKNIINKLLNNFVNGYRNKKLKQIIQGSKDDFENVMDGYIIGIQALKAEAKHSLDNYREFYSIYLLENKVDNAKSAIRVLVVRDYHQQEDVFAKIDQAMEDYLKILQKIKSGYVKLSNSTDRLTADDLKTSLEQCIKDLKYLKAQMSDYKSVN